MAEQSRLQFPMLVVPGGEDPGETRAGQVPISRGPAAPPPPRQEEIRTPGPPACSLEGNFTVGLYILEGGKRALYNGNTDTNVNLSIWHGGWSSSCEPQTEEGWHSRGRRAV